MMDDSDLVKGVAIILGLYWLMFVITYLCLEVDWSTVADEFERSEHFVRTYWYLFLICGLTYIPLKVYSNYAEHQREKAKEQMLMELAKRDLAEWWDKNNNS